VYCVRNRKAFKFAQLVHLALMGPQQTQTWFRDRQCEVFGSPQGKSLMKGYLPE